MKLTDEALREALTERGVRAPDIDLGRAARAVATSPQPSAGPGRPAILAVATTAAAVVLGAALLGSLAGRDRASPRLVTSPSGLAAGSPTATATSAPEPWTQLVWTAGAGDAFENPGDTFVQDGTAIGDGFVAVGYSRNEGVTTGRIWRSPDGRSWNSVDAEWLAGIELDHILRLDDGLVVVGARRPAEGEPASGPAGFGLWWSADGRSWDERSPDGSAYLDVDAAAAGPDGVLLLARSLSGRRDSLMLVADRDFHWRREVPGWPDDVRLFGVASGGERWLAFGATGAGGITTMRPEGTQAAIWTSADGARWVPTTIEQPGGYIDNVRALGGGLVALGSDASLRCEGCLGAIVLGIDLATWTSSDGRSWQRGSEHRVEPLRAGDTFYITQGVVAADDDRILAFDSDDHGRLRTWQTMDAVTWSEVSVLNGERADVGGLQVFPDFAGPVLVGPAGVVAFGRAPDDADATSTWPVPRSGDGRSPAPEDLPTFPPRPEPIPGDTTCPNNEPCGP